MVIGISGYSVYLPRHRLNRESIATVQGSRLPKGLKVVANYDEDALSMGVNAALPLCAQMKKEKVKELYFASTAKLYEDKLSSVIISTALSLPITTHAIDMANTNRALSESFRQGMKTIIDVYEDVLIVTADKRVGPVKSTTESFGGDGACAFQLSKGPEVIARFIESEVVSEDIYTYWKSASKATPSQWEDRFVQQAALQVVDTGIKNLLQKVNVHFNEIDHVIFSAPHPKLQASFYKQVNKPLPSKEILENGGMFGVANGGMMLADCLEKAHRDEMILLIEYGDGCQLTLFKTTAALEKYHSPSTVREQLEKGKQGLSYMEYLRWNGLVPFDEGRRPNTVRMSVPAMKRNEKQRLTLEGSQCQSCGTPFYPKQRICAKCGEKDQMSDYSFLGKTGKLVTYAVDYLAVSLAPPTMIGVVDFTDGGRMMIELTDCDPQNLQIGKEVSFNFRHLHENEGIHTYYWKAVLKEERRNE